MKNGISKDRILAITASILSIITIVFAVLGLLDVIGYSLYVTTPLLGVILGIQAYMNWHKNKGVAIFSICVSAFMIIVTAIVFFLK